MYTLLRERGPTNPSAFWWDGARGSGLLAAALVVASLSHPTNAQVPQKDMLGRSRLVTSRG